MKQEKYYPILLGDKLWPLTAGKRFGLERSLREFIRKNKALHLREYDTNGKSVYQNSIYLQYAICNDNTLHIRLHRTGAYSTDKTLLDYGEELCAITDCTELLTTIDNNPKYVEYVFSKAENPRSIFDIEKIICAIPDGKIEIDTNVHWSYPDSPHLAIIGGTGSGKSVLDGIIALQFLLKEKAYLYFIDPKSVDSADFKNVATCTVATDKAGYFAAIKDCIGIMDNRNAEMVKYGVKSYRDYPKKTGKIMRPIVLLIDELAALMASLDNKERKDFNNLLTQIVLKGRSAGITFIASAQRMSVEETLSGSLRDQLGLRIALGNVSDDGYRMLYRDITNLKSQPNQKGYYLLEGIMTAPRTFTTPYVSPDLSIAEALDRIEAEEWEPDNYYSDPVIGERLKEHVLNRKFFGHGKAT